MAAASLRVTSPDARGSEAVEPAHIRGRASRFAGLLAAILLTAPPSNLPANPVLEWDALMLDAIRESNTAPTLSTRNLAILHAGIFDAVNSIEPLYQPYRFQFKPGGTATPEAAVISAGRDILGTLYPGFAVRAQQLFANQLANLPATEATTNGLTVGEDAAFWILEDRYGDGASTEVVYVPSAEPGQWRRTAPAYRPPLDPHWRYVLRFCVDDPERFVVPPPPRLASGEYAEHVNDVRQWGALHSPLRTAYDTQTAVFWSDFSYTAAPPGHWNEIVHGIARDRNLTLIETARLFALLSLAQADAAILTWEAKYRYNLWRPETAIQRADEDGNAASDADIGWRPLLNAPNFPEYPSGHSTFSHAAAAVLADFFGTDAVDFDARSDSLPGVVRHYSSFKACANEIGRSRILGGIHFQFASQQGARSGEAIGQFVARNWLLPTHMLPRLTMERFSNGKLAVRMHGVVGVSYALQRTAEFDSWSGHPPAVGRPGGEVLLLPNDQVTGAGFFRLMLDDTD